MTYRVWRLSGFVLLGVFGLSLVMATPALANVQVDQCVAGTGFNKHQECTSQTSGLGQCNMCCTAIPTCTLWHGRLREIHLAITENDGCRGHCYTDFS